METAMFVSFYRSIVVFSLSHFERGELITFCVCPVVRCWNVVNAMTRQHSTLRYGRVINPFVFFSRPNAKQTTTTWNKHRKYKKKKKQKVVGFPSWPWYIRARRGVAPARLAASAQHAVHLAVSKAKETVRTLSDSFFCFIIYFNVGPRLTPSHTLNDECGRSLNVRK